LASLQSVQPTYICNNLIAFNFTPMSTATIQKQIDAIQRITAEALKTPESAKKILLDAGIIKADSQKHDKKHK
jgi:hypothetical protein